METVAAGEALELEFEAAGKSEIPTASSAKSLGYVTFLCVGFHSLVNWIFVMQTLPFIAKSQLHNADWNNSLLGLFQAVEVLVLLGLLRVGSTKVYVVVCAGLINAVTALVFPPLTLYLNETLTIVMLHLLCAVLGACSAVLQGSGFAIASVMPKNFVGAVSAGQGAAGAFVFAVVTISSFAMFNIDTHLGTRQLVWLVFSLSAAISLVCTGVFCMTMRQMWAVTALQKYGGATDIASNCSRTGVSSAYHREERRVSSTIFKQGNADLGEVGKGSGTVCTGETAAARPTSAYQSQVTFSVGGMVDGEGTHSCSVAVLDDAIISADSFSVHPQDRVVQRLLNSSVGTTGPAITPLLYEASSSSNRSCTITAVSAEMPLPEEEVHVFKKAKQVCGTSTENSGKGATLLEEAADQQAFSMALIAEGETTKQPAAQEQRQENRHRGKPYMRALHKAYPWLSVLMLHMFTTFHLYPKVGPLSWHYQQPLVRNHLVILFGLFCAAEFVGRFLPDISAFDSKLSWLLLSRRALVWGEVARLLIFVPFILGYALKNVVVINSFWWYCLLIIVLALTQGWMGTLAFFYSVTSVEDLQLRELSGPMTAIASPLGCVIGLYTATPY